MNEAQTWTAIGVLSAALIGVISIVATLFTRTMTVQFESLRKS